MQRLLAGTVPLFSPVGGAKIASTFTRASTAFDDAAVEPGSNLALWSQDLTNAYWTNNRVTATANAAAAPDGTATAVRLTEDSTAANTHLSIRNALVLAAGLPGTISIYAKAGERNWLWLGLSAGPANMAWFNLVTGVIGTRGGNLSNATIESVGGGWYRCSISIASVVSGSDRPLIGLANADAVSSYNGDGVSGLYVWGAQVEQTASPTRYKPTTSAVVGAPRWGGPDPEPTVNLALYSEQLDNAYWSKTLCTVTANATTAPDGAMTADKVMDTAAAGAKILFRGSVSTIGQPITFSVYAKAGELSWISPRVDNLPAWFDLANGVVGTVTAGLTASIQSVGDGWYRCTVSRSSVASVTEVSVRLNTADNQASYTGTGTQGVYLWGLQVEQKDHATPYTGATLGVPRARGILATEPTQNLLTANQSSFESGTTGVSTVGTATVASSAGWALSGTKSLLVTNTNSTNYIRVDAINQVQGVTRTASAHIYNANETNITVVFSQAGQAPTTVVVQPRQYVRAVSSWSATATGASHIRAYETTGQPFYLDCLQYEDAANPTDWVLGGTSRAGVASKGGILIEEGTTNLVQYSHELDNAWWTKSATTVTANAVVAPDGTLTADKLAEDATTASHYIQRLSLLGAAGTATISFYAKAAERSWVAVAEGNINGLCYFDLASGKVGTKGANVGNATITPVGGGWYRCSMPVTLTTGHVQVFASTGDLGVAAFPSYAGTAGSGVYAWGIQAEAKAYPTTYIPTSGATATRNAETLTIPTAGILRPDRGTVIVRFYADGDMAATTSASAHMLFSHRNTVNNNVLNLYRSGGALRFDATSAAGASSNLSSTLTLATGAHGVGIKWGADKNALFVDGALKTSVASPNLPSALASTVSLGCDANGNLQLDCPIHYVAIYDRALTDAEMAAATTGNLPAGYTAMVDFRGGIVVPSGRSMNPSYNPDAVFVSLNRNNTVMY